MRVILNWHFFLISELMTLHLVYLLFVFSIYHKIWYFELKIISVLKMLVQFGVLLINLLSVRAFLYFYKTQDILNFHSLFYDEMLVISFQLRYFIKNNSSKKVFLGNENYFEIGKWDGCLKNEKLVSFDKLGLTTLTK